MQSGKASSDRCTPRWRRVSASRLVEVDIESSPEVYERLKERIPLVVVDGRRAFKYRVDEGSLRRRLARTSRSGLRPVPL